MFDGSSFGLNADRSLAFQLPGFVETIATLRWTKGEGGWICAGPVAPVLDGDKGDYAACVLGSGIMSARPDFPACCSAFPAASTQPCAQPIAVDALGADKVRGVMLPFRFTAQESLDDAAKLTKALGIKYDVLPIAPAVHGLEEI